MTKTKSFFLNFVRWLSALFVVFGHTQLVNDYYFKNVHFNKYYTVFCHYDHSSVIIFFVLSGYLIFYTSRRYEKWNINAVKQYFIDRFSRIYSLLIPALALTIILDFAGRMLFKDIYLPHVPNDHYFFRLGWNLLSLQGTWGPRIQFAGNPALWSIGYEFSFYLIFAVYIFWGGLFWKNKYALLIIAAFFILKGPAIFIYFFIWLAGCMASMLSDKYKIKIDAGQFLFLLAAFFGIKNIVYRYGTFLNDNEYVMDFIYAFLFAILLIIDFKMPARQSSVFKKIKGTVIWLNDLLAGISFTIYAIHVPILFSLYAILYIYNPALNSQFPELISFSFVLFSVLVAYLFSFISEKQNSNLKSYLVSRFIPGKKQTNAIVVER